MVQFWRAPSRWQRFAVPARPKRKAYSRCLSSPSFKDGERLAVKNAGNNKTNPNCVVSPALAWAKGDDAEIFYNNERPGLWGPAFAGTTRR